MLINNQTYILSEMSASHEGDVKIAESIIESSSNAKADGILFQMIDLDTYIVPYDEDYEDTKSFKMSLDDWDFLIQKANSFGLDVWANVYDIKSAQFCRDKKIKGFKFHSSNLENEDLIKEVLNQEKDILLSVGGMNEKEITELIKSKSLLNSNIVLMYGLQNFPTNPNGINLNFINNISKKLNLKWGYQDHSEPESPASTYLPILAVSNGASIIEKHITHNRSLRGQDYESALNPNEFAQFVRDIKTSDIILSKKEDEVSDDEMKYKEYKTLMKVVAQKDIKIGDGFTKDNLSVMRCKKGEIPGGNLKLLINKESKNNYNKFEFIKKDEF